MIISHAEDISKKMGESELFASTNIPKLYLNLGWEVLKKDQEKYLLKKNLKKRFLSYRAYSAPAST